MYLMYCILFIFFNLMHNAVRRNFNSESLQILELLFKPVEKSSYNLNI